MVSSDPIEASPGDKRELKPMPEQHLPKNLMSLDAILHRVAVIERRRIWRWIGYMSILWLSLWVIYWGIGMHRQPDGAPLEEEPEAVEAFAEIYPIGL